MKEHLPQAILQEEMLVGRNSKSHHDFAHMYAVKQPRTGTENVDVLKIEQRLARLMWK